MLHVKEGWMYEFLKGADGCAVVRSRRRKNGNLLEFYMDRLNCVQNIGRVDGWRKWHPPKSAPVRTKQSTMGLFMGGPQCRMSILRYGIVACLRRLFSSMS